MAYADDIDSTRHRVGYYVAFDGVEDRPATHDMSAVGLSGTYLVCIDGAPSGGGSRLDRTRGLVLPGGVSVTLADTSEARGLLVRLGGLTDTLSAAITSTATTLTLSSGAATYLNGTDVYVDRETITLGTHSGSGTYTGCTRGAHTSQAAPHAGGSVVSNRPRHWLGRRLVLYAVNLDTGTQQAVRAGVVSESPRYADGRWQIEAIDVSRELRRDLCRGWYPSPWTTSSDDNTLFYADVPEPSLFVDGATYAGHVFIRGYANSQVMRLSPGDVETGNGRLALRYANVIQHFAGDGGDLEVRQVCLFTADPATAALILMLSATGDGSNHATYDVLPGRSAATLSDAVPARMGAGLPSAWVDVEAWEALIGIGRVMTVYLDEPTPLLDFLTEEVAPVLGGYVYVTASGQLSFQRWRPALPSGALESSGASIDADRDNLGGAVVTVEDESAILHSASWEVNYDPGQREYLRRIQVSWADQVATYGDELQTMERKSRTKWVGPASSSALVSPPYSNELQLVVALDRLYARTRDGLRRTELRLPWSYHLKAVPGWIFALTSSRMPDHEGAVGVSSVQYEIVSSEPDYGAGVVRVEAEQVQQGALIAPSFVINAYTLDGGGADLDQFDVRTTGAGADLFDSAAGRDFPPGCTVRVYDVSASPSFSVSGTLVVDSVADDAIYGDASGLGFTPASGDLVVLEYTANTGAVNADGADVRDHVFMTDSSGALGTSDPGTVWA